MSTDLLQLWAKLIEERTAAQAEQTRDALQAACDLATTLRDIPAQAHMDFVKAQQLTNKAWADYFDRLQHHKPTE